MGNGRDKQAGWEDIVTKDLVLTEIREGYRVITLNRPDSLNSFNKSSHAALVNALDEAEADKGCRALILTGAGRGFCAGQDLADVEFPPGGKPDLAVTLQQHYNPLIRRLRTIAMPTVAAVNGVAAGAGANIAFACDIVLAARSAKFIQAFSKIALVPDCGGTWFLPRLAGAARARALALLAEPLSAEQAEAWGVIWKVYDDASLMAEAHRLAAHFARQPTGALALIKQALDASETNTLDQQLDLERDLQGRAGRGPDFAEGVAAFLEKRAARFTGAM
jgi:2-(1,2-epoxy-1,2-dihydrophenyl)acetyl-CoA isomerase